MSAAENDAVVRRIFDAFARKEGLALRGLFAEDAVWSVPGRGVMAGTYEGRDAIFRFLAKLAKETDGTYGSELDRRPRERRPCGGALPRARHATRADARARPGAALPHRAGLVRHVLALPSDPDAFEAFWA